MLRRRVVASGRPLGFLHHCLIPHFHRIEGFEGGTSFDGARLGKPQDIVVVEELETLTSRDVLQLELVDCLPHVGRRRQQKQLYLEGVDRSLEDSKPSFSMYLEVFGSGFP